MPLAAANRQVVSRIAHPLVVFVAMLVLYATTMPRTITLEDAGLFQMVCHLGGLSHPPGYPLFTLLCHAVVRAPNAINGNLVSATFGALAVAMLHEVVYLVRRNRTFAYVASLAWGVTVSFWSQSIIIEVYSLAALLFMVCWWLTFMFVGTRKTGYWFALCFVYGLSLSDHWPLMILSTLGILATGWPALTDLLSRCKSPLFVAASLACFAVGLLPYVSLFLDPNPRIAVFGGIHSLADFVRYVSRSEYSDSNPVAGWHDKLMYAGWLLKFCLLQLGLIGAPFIVIGLGASFKRLPRSVSIALVLIFLGSTYILLMLLNFEYSPFFRAVFKPYPIIAVSAIAIWFALGVEVVAGAVSRLSGSGGRIVVGAALIAILASNFPSMDRSHSRLVADYMRAVFKALPRNAVLFVEGDNETGPMGFLHYVEGVRPDVEVRDWDNLVFDNRLSSPFSPQAAQQRRIKAFIDASTRPVVSMDDKLSPRIDYGAFFEFNPRGGNGYRFLPDFGSLVDMLVNAYRRGLVTDLQEKHFLFERLIQFSRQYVGYEIAQGRKAYGPTAGRRLAELQQTFPGKLITLQELVPMGADAKQKRVLLELADEAAHQIPAYATPQSLSVFYELYGRVELFAPSDLELAEKYLSKAVDLYPVPDNTAVCPLLDVYRREGDARAAQLIRSRFPHVKCGS